MVVCQKDDPEIRAYHTSISGFLQLEDIPYGVQGATFLCDVSTGHPRPFVPAGWRCKDFYLIHGLSHPFMRTTRKLMATKFIWHGSQKQADTWVKACILDKLPKTSSTSKHHLRISVSLSIILTTSILIW